MSHTFLGSHSYNVLTQIIYKTTSVDTCTSLNKNKIDVDSHYYLYQKHIQCTRMFRLFRLLLQASISLSTEHKDARNYVGLTIIHQINLCDSSKFWTHVIYIDRQLRLNWQMHLTLLKEPHHQFHTKYAFVSAVSGDGVLSTAKYFPLLLIKVS